MVNSLGRSLFPWPARSKKYTTLNPGHEGWAKCKKENSQFQLCDINYLVVYSRAAERTYLSEADPQPQLKKALETLATIRKLGGSFRGRRALRRPGAAGGSKATKSVRTRIPRKPLAEQRATLTRCFATAASDAMCRTLAAQADLVAADWQAQLNKPTLPTLTLALQKATEATKSPETYPDAWRVLAETHLKLAQATSANPKARDKYLIAGLAAIQKVFAVNPKHALGRATLGARQFRGPRACRTRRNDAPPRRQRWSR